MLYSLGFLHKAVEALTSIRKKNQVFTDLETSVKEGYTKFDPGESIDIDLPELPFDIYIKQEKAKKREFDIKLPPWAPYVFVNRDFIISFLKRDFWSKIPGIFSSIFSSIFEKSDPKKVDKLIEAILKDLSKLDKG
jgi:hypothetical protein